MTAPAKPTIDEQIEELGNPIRQLYPVRAEYRDAILSTLRAHKKLMEAERDAERDRGDQWEITATNLLNRAEAAERNEKILREDKEMLRDALVKESGFRQESERQLAELQAKHDALVAMTSAVCEKDPVGCWRVRCHLGKDCAANKELLAAMSAVALGKGGE